MVGSYRFGGQQKDGSEVPVAVKDGIQSDSGIHPASNQLQRVAFSAVKLPERDVDHSPSFTPEWTLINHRRKFCIGLYCIHIMQHDMELKVNAFNRYARSSLATAILQEATLLEIKDLPST